MNLINSRSPPAFPIKQAKQQTRRQLHQSQKRLNQSLNFPIPKSFNSRVVLPFSSYAQSVKTEVRSYFFSRSDCIFYSARSAEQNVRVCLCPSVANFSIFSFDVRCSMFDVHLFLSPPTSPPNPPHRTAHTRRKIRHRFNLFHSKPKTFFILPFQLSHVELFTYLWTSRMCHHVELFTYLWTSRMCHLWFL